MRRDPFGVNELLNARSGNDGISPQRVARTSYSIADARGLRLESVLIHLLWQGALVPVTAAAVLHFLRNAEASRRYAVLLGLFLVMAMMPVATFLIAGAEPMTGRHPVAQLVDSSEWTLAAS